MADFDSVRQTIDASIRQNGTGAITGPVLNGVLNEMVDAADEQVSQLRQDVHALNVFIQVVQDGFFFVDSAMNIGVYVDANGIHADNILEYQIVNL